MTRRSPCRSSGTSPSRARSTRSPRTGVSSHLVLGKLPRLAGADAVVYPEPVRLAAVHAIEADPPGPGDDRTVPWASGPTLPVPGGGLHAGHDAAACSPTWAPTSRSGRAAPSTATRWGRWPAPGPSARRSTRSCLGEPLADAGSRHPELGAALDRWPGDGGPADAGGSAEPSGDAAPGATTT